MRPTLALALLLALAAAAPARAQSTATPRVHAEGEIVVSRFAHAREDGASPDSTPATTRALVAIALAQPCGARGTLEARVSFGREADAVPRVQLERAEFAWRACASLTLHAGVLPVPSGFTNVAPEGDARIGTQRSGLEALVIPAVWSAPAVGASGTLPGRLAWSALALEGLDARRITAARWIRAARPRLDRGHLAHPAFAARLDWNAAPAFALGGSCVSGEAWQGTRPDPQFHPRVWVNEAHARLATRGAEVRALYVMSLLWDHTALSQSLGLAHSASALGKHAFGGLVEGAYTIPGAALQARLRPYARFELTDTQDGVGAIGTEDPAFHRTTLTLGAEYRLAPNVHVRADHEQRHHEDESGVSQWNVAVLWRN